MENNYTFDWADLAFASKKPLSTLNAVFIAAPRELSQARLKSLLKTYLSKSNIIFGVSKEPFVEGYENQPQFRMTPAAEIYDLATKVNRSDSKYKIAVLSYFQRELPYIIEKVDFAAAVFVNGSWKQAFHTLPSYYLLARRAVPYELVSPFCDEAEAIEYANKIGSELPHFYPPNTPQSDVEASKLVEQVARFSFDWGFQTGAILVRQSGQRYTPVAWSHNKVVPYESYALHHGAQRELHFSPPNDLNHYDTVHAEVAILIAAQKQKMDLAGTALFINLLPCPTCSRMLALTDISEVVYQIDHSDGYAVRLLEQAGKSVRRVVL